VNYRPNAHDADHRLLAESGANFRETFAVRVSDPRYTSGMKIPTANKNGR
jgi:hypothetical protein